MKNNLHLSIVVPAHNEEGNVKLIAKALADTISNIKEIASWDLIFVDDGSTDSTWKLIQEIAEEYPVSKSARLSRNFGKEGGISAGLDLAGGDAVVIMDADLQHPPEVMAKMIRLWIDEDVQIVNAVKSSRGRESIIKRMGADTFYWLMRRFTGLSLANQSDFKLLDRKALEQWKKFSETLTFYRGLVDWTGLKTATVEFVVPDRATGSSAWSSLRLTAYAIHNLSAFTTIPLYFVSIIGGLSCLLSFVLALRAIYIKFTYDVVDGFTTMIILLLFMSSLIMINLGIIGLYLSNIYYEIKKRPRYIIQDQVADLMKSKNLSQNR